MLLEEWNMEDAIAYAKKEAREDGREEGRAEGFNQGRSLFFELLDQGLSTDEIKQRLSSEQ